MPTRARRVRLACAGVLLLAAAGCSSQQSPETAAPVIPPAEVTVPQTGPGTYIGEATNVIGVPVPVRVVIAADTAAPSAPDAPAVSAFLSAAAAELQASALPLRYVDVQVDNTGELDAVPLPENVDVLDAEGRGANFRPAYDIVRESQELLAPTSKLYQRGAVLARRLLVREDSVRPGQAVTVLYVSTDPLADVAQVIVNGEPARKQEA